MPVLMHDSRAFAIAAHGDQTYGDAPYVVHLEAVVSIIRQFGYEQPYINAGWLHDVVEDTEVELAEIADHFGQEVASMVDAVTGLGINRPERNARIYAGLEACPKAAVIKLADRIANVEAAVPGSKHAARYLRESAEFKEAVASRVPAAMWSRLESALIKACGG
jgi:(p)ppGpp synthase/HD superfamily hydrolase